MKFTIQVLIESPDALPLSVPVQTIERSCERIEDVGLRLEEAKAILSALQDQLVRHQISEHLHRHRACPSCHQPRTIKGLQRLSEALALWCGGPVRVVLAVQGPEAFCNTRRWFATFEQLTGRPLVEIELADALPAPVEGGFADVRRMLLSRMVRG